MQIREIMSSPVVAVELDDALSDVKRIFDSSKIRHILVKDEGRLVGVISERDLLRAISPFVSTEFYTPRDLATLNRRVYQIVTRKPHYLRRDDPVSAVIQMFQVNRVGCIPVVDEDGMPVGIVTRGDVIRHFDAICASGHPAP